MKFTLQAYREFLILTLILMHILIKLDFIYFFLSQVVNKFLYKTIKKIFLIDNSFRSTLKFFVNKITFDEFIIEM